jgi:hypothetical protein
MPAFVNQVWIASYALRARSVPSLMTVASGPQ